MGSRDLTGIQGLRGIAFTMVFLSHAIWRYGELGYFGVEIFIVMSGALLVRTYYNREQKCVSIQNCLSFALEKIKKIYPLHIFTMLCFTVLAIVGHADMIKTAIKISVNVLLVQAWFPNSEINTSMNGVSWYLSLSAMLYFVFPLILKVIKNINRTKTILLSTGIVLSIQLAMLVTARYFFFGGGYYDWFSYIFPLYRLGDFIIGCFCGYLIFIKDFGCKIKLSMWFNIFTIILCAVSIFLSEKQFDNYVISALTTRSIVYLVPSLCLVVIASCGQTKLFNNQIIVKLGNISSYAYLIHMVVIIYAEVALSKLPSISLPIAGIVAFEYVLTVLLSVLWMAYQHRTHN